MPSVFHSVERIGAPFLAVDEQLFVVPARGHIVTNHHLKLLFALRGVCRHEIAGETGLAREVEFSEGDILILPRPCRQIYRPLGDEAARFHALRLVVDETRAEEGDEIETDIGAFAAHYFGRARHLPAGQSAEIRETLGHLRHEAETRAPGYRLRVRALCLTLVVLTARASAQTAIVAADDAGFSRRERLISEVKEYLHKHRDADFALADIAAHLKLSSEHLSRLFKAATGQTIFSYARQLRLEHAKTLLCASDRNMSEIARECGFSSPALFSRNFKDYTGFSPLQYRGRQRG